MTRSSKRIFSLLAVAALTLLLVVALGWLFRFYPHVYLVVLLLTIFGGVPIFTLRHRGALRLVCVVLLAGVIGGGFAGLFWDNLLAGVAA